MSAAFNPEAWSDFFVAEAGASAALTGLVIVAISINLQVIIKTRLLSGRAAETVALLAGVLVLSTLGLVPGQPVPVFGMECVGVGLVIAGVTSLILFRVRKVHHDQEQRWLRRLFNWGASLPLMAGGVSLLAGTGGGLYWLVPGVVLALTGGIINTWILLIEILR
jgi:modulator of FtsH protease